MPVDHARFVGMIGVTDVTADFRHPLRPCGTRAVAESPTPLFSDGGKNVFLGHVNSRILPPGTPFNVLDFHMRPEDTSSDAWNAQVSVWRSMGASRRLGLALTMSDDARAVTVDGILSRHPEYSREDARHAMLRMVLGDAVYRAAWPHREVLDP